MEPVARDELRFDCPRCGSPEVDDYEAIDASVAFNWRCSGCSRVFSILMVECLHCASESVETALEMSEHIAIGRFVCQNCGQHCQRHEEAAEPSESV